MKDESLLKLYLAMRSEHVEWISRHSQHFSYYLTLVVAVFAVTMGASYRFLEPDSGEVAVVVAFLGSAANILLCIVAIRACNRFYRRFLESVTVMAKLEAYLKLEKRPPDAGDPFGDDQHWLPQRFYDDRDCHKSGESFVKARMNNGLNYTVRATMVLLAVLNFVSFLVVFSRVFLSSHW